MFRLSNAMRFAAENRWTICCAVFAAYMIILSIMDIRNRKLKLSVLLAGFLFIPAGIVCGNAHPVFLASGGAVGVVFVGVSKVTEEAFGYGDSILIIIMGSFLGFWEILSLLTGAFLLAAAFALVILIRNRFRRKDTFPFVPFLSIAYIGGLVIGAF